LLSHNDLKNDTIGYFRTDGHPESAFTERRQSLNKIICQTSHLVLVSSERVPVSAVESGPNYRLNQITLHFVGYSQGNFELFVILLLFKEFLLVIKS
jgi:hypothetical protein